MLAHQENPASAAGEDSAPGQFAERLAHWGDVEKGIASTKGNFDSARAAVQAVVGSKVEVKS